MLPVGLYEWKITKFCNCNLVLTIMLKNILRIFETEIFKMFKNIQSEPKS